MKYRAGMGINIVVLTALGLVVLAASGIMVQMGSGDISDTAEQGVSDSECDTWAERSTTAGSDDADVWEQRYNDNCQGTLSEVSDGGGFFEEEYDESEHEDGGYLDFGGSSGSGGSEGAEGADSGGAATIGEGESEEVEQLQGSITYLGRDDNTLSKKAHIRYHPDGNMGDSMTGSVVGCQQGSDNIVSGVPLSELPSDVGECAYSTVVDTMVGEMKFAICSIESNGINIAVGPPDENGKDICENYSNIELT